MLVQDGLELAIILLLQSLEGWDFRFESSHLALSTLGSESSLVARLTLWPALVHDFVPRYKKMKEPLIFPAVSPG